MGELSGKCVLLGVTGGIAAYKAAEVASRLVKKGVKVRAVMTKNACEFITPLTLQTLTGQPVYTDTFARSWEIEHIALAKEADVMLIAPATANILGKIASGIADDLLSTTAMAIFGRAPILAAPAMNTHMWFSPANQRNLQTLSDWGVKWVGPESGMLACGDVDVGRMSQPAQIVEAVFNLLLPKKDFSGKRVLVTAGPTREAIDPVRFLSNHSSGRMGYALAQAARDRGAEVVLVSGPVNLQAPARVEVVPVVSTLDMHDAVVSRAPQMDVIIQAAAPADFRPQEYMEHKIKKDGEGLQLDLSANPDIAVRLGQNKHQGQVLVVFAAESQNLVENARKKLLKKNATFVVANDITQEDAGFGADTNRVILVDALREEELPLLSKYETANKILDKVLEF